MMVLLAVCGSMPRGVWLDPIFVTSELHHGSGQSYLWTPVCFTTSPHHGLMQSYRSAFSKTDPSNPSLIRGMYGVRATPSIMGQSQLLFVVTLVKRPSAQNSIFPAPIPPRGTPLSLRPVTLCLEGCIRASFPRPRASARAVHHTACTSPWHAG